MIWFAASKKIRTKEWHTAPAPSGREEVRAAHKWCIEQTSDGTFYRHYTNTRWWFEKKEDAIMFALTWSGR